MMRRILMRWSVGAPTRVRAAVGLSALLLATALRAQVGGAPATSDAVYDVVLRRGTIVDGTGARRYVGDLAIAGGRIVRIGDLSAARGAVELDVSGLLVAPGFVNIHSHAVPGALPSAENMLTQGVTTEILNPDGGGPTDVARQLSALAAAGLAVNVGANIGFNSVWAAVMGQTDRRATPAEIDRMRRLVLENLERGAWGVSAGLDYKPAYYATAEEVIEVVRPAAQWRTSFANHDRLTPETRYSSRLGIAETIRIGETAGLMPLVTHMKVQGREQGSAPAVLAMMRQATARGHYTAADVYPYLAGQTALAALIIPGWAQDGGREAMLARFRDPAQRARIVAEADEALAARFGGAAGVLLPATQRQLVDVMRELQLTSGGEAVVRILETESPSAILRFGAERDLVALLQHPTTSVACDCGATTSDRGHPRAFGTFPRVLGRYVRERKLLTWEDAIRKMTGLPASTVGMVDRGFLAPGMAADVVVLDTATVIDHATYEEPARRSAGIRHVLVNGRFALRDGAVTGDRAGRALVRTPHMPSRPLRAAVARRVAARGTLGDPAAVGGAPARVEIALAVSQHAGARRATGTFRLRDPRTGTVVEARELGLLQTTARWASFTGVARVRAAGGPAGATPELTRALTVIIEQADPSVDGRPATVTVDIEGRERITGALPPGAVTVSPKR
jgi:N-acyl-D-aspartate/D-glutamate deacylase